MIKLASISLNKDDNLWWSMISLGWHRIVWKSRREDIQARLNSEKQNVYWIYLPKMKSTKNDMIFIQIWGQLLISDSDTVQY